MCGWLVFWRVVDSEKVCLRGERALGGTELETTQCYAVVVCVWNRKRKKRSWQSALRPPPASPHRRDCNRVENEGFIFQVTEYFTGLPRHSRKLEYNMKTKQGSEHAHQQLHSIMSAIISLASVAVTL